MTSTSQIIIDAFRQGNLLAIGVAPTQLEMDEALRYLNRIVKSVFGFEVGETLTAFPLGRDNTYRPAGYPWYSNKPGNDWYVPKNTRLIANITEPLDIYLTPDPDDGCRFAVQDLSSNLATYPLTVYGNGRLIDGQTSIVIDTDGFDAEWLFRADLGNWMKYAPLTEVDEFPFPEEYDFFFIIQLAMALNPTMGVAMDPQTQETYRRAKSQIRAKYAQNIQVRAELALIRPARTAADRDIWGSQYYFFNPDDMFNKGWPW